LSEFLVLFNILHIWQINRGISWNGRHTLFTQKLSICNAYRLKEFFAKPKTEYPHQAGVVLASKEMILKTRHKTRLQSLQCMNADCQPSFHFDIDISVSAIHVARDDRKVSPSSVISGNLNEKSSRLPWGSEIDPSTGLRSKNILSSHKDLLIAFDGDDPL